MTWFALKIIIWSLNGHTHFLFIQKYFCRKRRRRKILDDETCCVTEPLITRREHLGLPPFLVLLNILVFYIVFFCFVFGMCLVCPVLAVSLDCPFVIVPSVLSNVYVPMWSSILLSISRSTQIPQRNIRHNQSSENALYVKIT
jgi:hypothetical protein